MQSVHSQSKEAVFKWFSEGPKVAKKRERTDDDESTKRKASNATQHSLKESFAAAGPKLTQTIYESKVCNKITISCKQTK